MMTNISISGQTKTPAAGGEMRQAYRNKWLPHEERLVEEAP